MYQMLICLIDSSYLFIIYELFCNKKLAYYEATSRVISFKTARKTDLMLCVKENQMAFALHIIKNFVLLDVIDLRGLEEYVQVPSPGQEKTQPYSTKQWNPIVWAFQQQKQDYVKIFFEQIKPHLTHCLDVNPARSLYVDDKMSEPDQSYINKGRMQAMVILIYQKNWDTFRYVLDKTIRYWQGWHLFATIRAFVDIQWISDGLFKFMREDSFKAILRQVPDKNRKDLVSNIVTYSRYKLPVTEVQTFIDTISGLISEVDQYKVDEVEMQELTNKVFDCIFMDYSSQLEKTFSEVPLEKLLLMSGRYYTGVNYEEQTSIKKTTYTSLGQLEEIKFERANAVTFALMCNSQRSLEFLSKHFNMAYAFVKPGACDYNDMCSARHQIFALSYTLCQGYIDMFKLLIESFYSQWRVEHLKLIFDEVITYTSADIDVMYLLRCPRIQILFNYLIYEDRMLLIGHILSRLKDEYTITMRQQQNLKFQQEAVVKVMCELKPFCGPYAFQILTNPSNFYIIEVSNRDEKMLIVDDGDQVEQKPSEKSKSLFNPTKLIEVLTNDDITEYITSVGSNQALFMISALSQLLPRNVVENEGTNLQGLQQLIEKIEGNFNYF